MRSTLPSRTSAMVLRMAAASETDNPYYKGMDAYQILEVPRTADKKEIKAAYRKGEMYDCRQVGTMHHELKHGTTIIFSNCKVAP